MLTGRVTAEKEAVVQIQVLGPAGKVTLVEAAIDTGCDGFLTLPASLIRDLDLPFAGTARATLGDGNEVRMDLFLAAVVWEEERCEARSRRRGRARKKTQPPSEGDAKRSQ